MSRLGLSLPKGVAVRRVFPLVFAALRSQAWRLAGFAVRSLPASVIARKPAGRLKIAPPDIRAADRSIGHDIEAGYFLMNGHAITVPRDHSPFADPSAHPEWLRAINSFAFLRHLRVADNIDAGARARALITGWLDGKARQDRSAWPVDVVARRVISWLSHAPMFLDGIGAQEHERFLRSLAAQTAFLKLAARFGPKGHPRLLACIAVAMAALCTGESKTRTARAGRRLAAEIQRQIFSDGGHVSRDPLVVAELLLDLLPLRQTYLATSVEPPENLMNAIERMMPMVRFFRHRDGTLARFNGCGASATAELATILAYDDTRGEPLRSAPHSGFERLTGLGATLIMDTGRHPPVELSNRAHAGTLSFEFSTHSGILIVNCGSPLREGTRWAEVCRSTAAHSTATLDDTSSAQFMDCPLLAGQTGKLIVRGPARVLAERRDGRESQEVVARHDGYADQTGYTHERRIVLSDDGTRLDGEDSFTLARPAAAREGGSRFAIRFHLHPFVEVSTSQVGGLLLQVGNRETWGVFADGATITLEESVFVNGPEAPRRTRQIVLSGDCAQNPHVYWSFIRSDHRAARPQGDPVATPANPA